MAGELKEINDRIYSMVPIDPWDLHASDLSELVKRPGTISFSHEGSEFEIKVVDDNDRIVILYQGGHYLSAAELITSAFIGENPFNEVMFETCDWRMI